MRDRERNAGLKSAGGLVSRRQCLIFGSAYFCFLRGINVLIYFSPFGERLCVMMNKLPRPLGRGIDKQSFAVTLQAAGYQTQGFAMNSWPSKFFRPDFCVVIIHHD